MRVVTQGDAHQPERDHRRRVEHQERRRHQLLSGLEVDAGEVGDPVRLPHERASEVGRDGGDGGVLDVVEERHAVAAEQQQRQPPPRGGQHREERPPAQQPPAPRAAGAGDQEDDAQRQHRDDGDRIDTAAGRDHQGTECRGSPHRAALAAIHERQQHPRRQRHRPDLDRDPAEQRGDPRGEHERERRQHLGAGCAEVELAGQPQDPEERHAEQQRPPQPLDDPGRQPGKVADDEERPHRPGVAVGLVLQLAERRRRVPQLQSRRQEPARSGDQVELGVGDHLSGGLRERERCQDHGVAGLAQHGGRQRPGRSRPLAGRRFAHRARTTITRFHVTSSRRPGTLVRK